MRQVIFTTVLSIFCFTMVFSAPRPDWLTQPPVNSDYYIGIGSAPVTGNSTDYMQTAQQNALNNLAAQIKVKISGELVNSLIETDDTLEETLQKTIRQTTQADLEGYELVDQYNNNQTYYVYYHLSKRKYATIQRQKRDKASALSLSLFATAEDYLMQGNPGQTVDYLIKSLEAIDKYILEGLETSFEGDKIYLGNFLFRELQDILDQIEIIPSAKTMDVKAGRPLKGAKFTVLFDGTPVKNAMLTIDFNQDGNEYQKQVKADRRGNAVLRGATILNRKKIQICKATFDLNSKSQSNTAIVSNLISKLSVPGSQILFKVSGPSIYISSEEKLDNVSVKLLRIEPVFKDMLTKQGYHFTDSEDGADYYVEIKANARQGSQVSSLFTSFADLNISIMEMSSGNEIYSNSLTRVKGIDLSFEKAEIKALDALGAKLSEEIVPEILEHLH